MFSADVPNGVIQIAPPVAVAGEVAARYYGLSISEWFYVTAIFCMVISTFTTSLVAILKARRKE
jgi:hypothetical protein